MKRVLLIILLHLSLFFIVFVYQAQAEEEWTIDTFKDLTYARVSGEVTHGDSLNFFISRNDDCLKVYNNFTCYNFSIYFVSSYWSLQ